MTITAEMPIDTTNITHQQNGTDTLMESLAEAAKVYDNDTFIELIRDVDWSQRTIEELYQTSKLALKMGMSLLTKKLVKKGMELAPDHAEFQRLHNLFFPKNPSRRVKGTPIKGFKESVEWLEKNAHMYRGKWIGVNQGKLVGVTDTYEELCAIIDNSVEEPRSTFMHKVL